MPAQAVGLTRVPAVPLMPAPADHATLDRAARLMRVREGAPIHDREDLWMPDQGGRQTLVPEGRLMPVRADRVMLARADRADPIPKFWTV
jgi:hypothetical protein